MTGKLDEIMRGSMLFGRLTPEDRQRLTAVSVAREFDRGATLFAEGDGSDFLYTIMTGRVKVFKITARGTDVILDIFGPGDPVGAVAVYESRPYPATAVALEPTTCVLVPRQAFFSLLETYPTMVRGLLVGLTHRLAELTTRLTELSGGRVEERLARFFLKLADTMGQPGQEGTHIPMALSRQELADMIGTTIETSIRVMSRWGKQGIVRTEKDGFVLLDRARARSGWCDVAYDRLAVGCRCRTESTYDCTKDRSEGTRSSGRTRGDAAAAVATVRRAVSGRCVRV